LTLTGNGDWRSSDSAETSDFKMRFTAEDLGKMLGALGFAGHVSGGQTLAELNAQWMGSPIEFALAKLNGNLKVWVGGGRFLELEPGAGRVFGLLSVRELPRRLALDFSDFFKSGMSFSEIAGTFEFKAGDAFTEDLLVRSPAADIQISGRTGLSQKDYEQTAIVNPKMGVLPVVGAIAGGPAGAAAGLVAQRVFDRENPLGTRYTITGSWEKPLVQKEPVQRTARNRKRSG
jgi:uncharacterized protein YhdP